MKMIWVAVAEGAGLVALSLLLLRLARRQRVLAHENERWRESARTRADQVAMFAHEVRTPLALIRGSGELLADDPDGSDMQRDLARTVTSNAGRMEALAHDLLAEARIDAGLFTMRMSTVNLRRLALEVVRETRRLEHVPISFECRGAPPRVAGDPGLLRQVFVNLLTNAIRHAGAGARVTLSLRSTEDAVLASVSDDGAGMSEEARRALFRRTAEGKSESGNGLGMLISEKIALQHGGHLMVDTVTGKGTTMTLALPRHPDDQPAVAR